MTFIRKIQMKKLKSCRNLLKEDDPYFKMGKSKSPPENLLKVNEINTLKSEKSNSYASLRQINDHSMNTGTLKMERVSQKFY
jgi:hypothetical protein